MLNNRLFGFLLGMALLLGCCEAANATTPMVAVGVNHSIGLSADGKIYGWGDNGYGQLGDGTTTARSAPVQVSGLTGVIAISAGGSHTVALKGDGSVWAWGLNMNGELGDGTLAQRSSPVLVVNPSVDGYLNLNSGSVIIPPHELNVPFFVSSTGRISDTSATVSTTIKFNAADVSKQNSVFITAMVPKKYFGLANNVRPAAVNMTATDPNACVPAYLTSNGLQQAVNSQVIPFASGVSGEKSQTLIILNSTDTTNQKGAEYCMGYGTSAEEMAAAGRMRAVATIPVDTIHNPSKTNACTNSCTVVGSSGANVLEFYNTNLDHFFITADASEAAAIDNGSAGPGWSRTGYNFKSGGNTAVCRFYGSQSPGPNSHFYTVDASECAYLKQLQASTPDTEKRWNFESLDFDSTPPLNGACPGGTQPVYRAYNNGFTRDIDSSHRITGSLTALQEVVTRGWRDEGMVMCAPN